MLPAQLPVPVSHPPRGRDDVASRGEGVDRLPAGRGTARAPAEPAAIGPHDQLDPDRHQRKPVPRVDVGGNAVLLQFQAQPLGALGSGDDLGAVARHEPIRAHDATALRPEPEHSKHLTVDSCTITPSSRYSASTDARRTSRQPFPRQALYLSVSVTMEKGS